ncbi:MAG: hypothetical protein IT215_00640 [Chitinophagaceae bacterium]|nr:hypothetical protein [Chitinophagaceae bacterium]
MNENKPTLIKISKEAKDTLIQGCYFEGDCTHVDNEGENTKLVNNKHRLGQNKEKSFSSGLKITD